MANPALPYGYVPKTKLYKHQIVGIEELERHNAYGLFDQMGLGKTLELLYMALDSIRGGRFDCALIVCKSSHARVWTKHITEHAPNTAYHSIIGKAPAVRKQAWPLKYPLYLVNYELLSRTIATEKRRRETVKKGEEIFTLPNGVCVLGDDAANLRILLRNRRVAIILDESQAMKNHTAKVTGVLHGLAKYATHRYIATGTPVAERPDDLWSQIHFLDDGALLGRSYWRFISIYADFVTVRGRRWIKRYRHLDDLRNKVKSISIRRTKDQCLDLPPKTYEEEHLTAVGMQKTMMSNLRTEMKNVLMAMSSRQLTLQKGTSFSKCFQDMQRVAAMPCVIDPNCKVSAKFNALVDYMESMNGDQIVVWCVNKDVTTAVAEQLNSKKGAHTAIEVHGGIPVGKQRDQRIDAFIGGRYRALVATMGTLREAVTLTNAQHAFYMQLDFQLTNWAQSQDRIHRIGTTGTVVINTPMLLGSLDTYIHDHLLEKEQYATGSTDHKVIVLSKQGLLKTLKKGG